VARARCPGRQGREGKICGVSTSPTVVAYFGEDPPRVYQLAQWLPVLELLDADQPVTGVATMEERLGQALSQPRFGMLLLTLFAGVALLLAAVGVYGVVAYEARQRTHEIGIRAAIGAEPWSILRLVVGDGLKLALAGTAIGVAAALALMRLLSSLLYGVGQYDPVTFLAMPAALVLAALLAAYLPARRAMRVDPVVALRQD